MAKLPALKPKEVIRVLEKAGFVFVRQKGSHKLYTRSNVGVIVPHHNKDLKKGTLRHIIKEAGFSTKEFFGLLKD